MPETFEIFINNKWVHVTKDIFRSYTGARCMNDRVYQGPRYKIGSDEECNQNQECIDLCCDCGNNMVQHKYGTDGDIVCEPCLKDSECADEDAYILHLEMKAEGFFI